MGSAREAGASRPLSSGGSAVAAGGSTVGFDLGRGPFTSVARGRGWGAGAASAAGLGAGIASEAGIEADAGLGAEAAAREASPARAARGTAAKGSPELTINATSRRWWRLTSEGEGVR